MTPTRDRRPDEYDPGTAAYEGMRLRQDPNYQLPDDYEFSQRTQNVERKRSGYDQFIDKYWPYMFAAAGAGPLAYSAATGTGMFASGAGAAGAAGAGAGAGAAGAGAAGAGGAAAGGAAAGAGGSGAILPTLIKAGVSLGGGAIAGNRSRAAANKAAGGATLAQLMPMIMAMIQAQQGTSQQNYQNQVGQYHANQPLQDAVRNMAMSLTPNHLKGGR